MISLIHSDAMTQLFISTKRPSCSAIFASFIGNKTDLIYAAYCKGAHLDIHIRNTLRGAISNDSCRGTNETHPFSLENKRIKKQPIQTHSAPWENIFYAYMFF